MRLITYEGTGEEFHTASEIRKGKEAEEITLVEGY